MQLILYIWFNLFPVKEFDEEVDGEIHHKHHLLTTVALTAEPDYDQSAEPPEILSDDEEACLTWAWPDKEIPRQASASAIPESAKEALVQDLLLQHNTSVKVLSQLRVDVCKEYQRSSAIGVLTRVRQGNRICSICKESFSSTQVLRTHIQGQHMDAPHLKCSWCDYHAGDAYALRFHQRKHDPATPRFQCKHTGCNKSYTTCGYLNEHSKLHTGTRTPPCPNCGKTFTVSSGLKSHLLSCIPDGQPMWKMFKCDVCDKAYYRSGELARHCRDKSH